MIKYYLLDLTLGNLKLYFNDDGIIAISFNEESDNLRYISKYFKGVEASQTIDNIYINEIVEYLSGKRKSFTIPFVFKGTDFQQKVWKELLNIPYGETRTYKDIAVAIGCEKGYRAVGGALNKNPIPLIIPCHRVIGSNKSLTGFQGGLDIKEKLLQIEKLNK